MQATANIPAKIAPTNHPIAIRRLVNFYLFYLNKAVHFNYFLIFLASFLSFSIFIWIAAATNARSFRSSPRYSCGHLYFNPRTRVGCDPLVRLPDPPGGYFNPRTRVGCDLGNGFDASGLDLFQSTHPGGVRRSFLRMQRPKNSISIHAPAWGATNYLRLQGGQRFISIHAPAWGATPVFIRAAKLVCISIHAPAWGATLYLITHTKMGVISIHAPAWGATYT